MTQRPRPTLTVCPWPDSPPVRSPGQPDNAHQAATNLVTIAERDKHQVPALHATLFGSFRQAGQVADSRDRSVTSYWSRWRRHSPIGSYSPPPVRPVRTEMRRTLYPSVRSYPSVNKVSGSSCQKISLRLASACLGCEYRSG